MKNRHGPLRRSALAGVVAAGLVLALAIPGVALAGQVPKLSSSNVYPMMQLSGTGSPKAIPVQGADRYQVAVEASKKFGTAQNVVIATGVSWPDALGGAALAGAVKGPILLTPADKVPAEVLAEIERLGATKAYILGGTKSVSSAAEKQIDSLPGVSVERIAGADRYEVANKVAAKTIALLGDEYQGKAFMATGENFPDALASSPIMYAKGMPLVLVDKAGRYSLPAGVTEVVILGGTKSVPYTVEKSLGGKYHGQRLSGADRYDTAKAVAEYGVSGDVGLGWDKLGVATGENFPDGLCAGPLVGKNNSVLLLTQTAKLPTQTQTLLKANAGKVNEYYLFGGMKTIQQNVRDDIQEALTPVLKSHDLPFVFCTTSGCHGTDAEGKPTNIASIHGPYGCLNCHAGTPSRDCESCHPDAHAMTHPDVQSTSDEPCTQSGCHADGVVAIHTNCTDCHKAGVNLKGATCETCHKPTQEQHKGVAAHTISSTEGCFTRLCHGNDVTKMHGTDFRGAGEDPPGCAACHAEGVTPSTSCLNGCHNSKNFGKWHDQDTAHAVVQDTIAANSKGCVACHGSDLMDVAPSEHKGCSCHAYTEARGANACETCHTGPHAAHVDPDPHAAWAATAAGDKSGACVECHGSDLLKVGNVDPHIKDAHAGCICHHYDKLAETGMVLIGATTDEAAECVDCHTGAFAPHGFATEESPHHDESWVSASGHNTTTFPGVGAFTKFDGSEGVTIRDAGGQVITAEYPLPTQNVFWSEDDTRAPEGAVKGLDWDSVITCEDCHTNLENLEVTGPHGATVLASVGIDPNFPGDYATAALWAFAPVGADGSVSTAATTQTAAASGIIQYIPGGPDTTAPSAYALKTWISTSTAVPGPAVVKDPDTVICAKCHDLHNPGTGHGATGDGITGDGYAHYHGHEYHDDPINWAGLYQRSDGTTYTAFSALNEGDTQLKAPSTGRGASGHCRNCHVAVPHGWKRPRLLVYETDRAPYNIGPSVEVLSAELEGRTRTVEGVGTRGEGGQIRGIGSTASVTIRNEGLVNEYVEWTAVGDTGQGACYACGHHQYAPPEGRVWK